MLDLKGHPIARKQLLKRQEELWVKSRCLIVDAFDQMPAATAVIGRAAWFEMDNDHAGLVASFVHTDFSI